MVTPTAAATNTATELTSTTSSSALSSSQQQHQSILPSSSSYSDDVDVESLRQVLSGTSPEELRRRKPHELRELLEEKGSTNIPRFLLDAKDENHIAPHMLALELLLGRNRRHRGSNINGSGDGIYRRVDTTDNTTNDNDNNNIENDEEEQQKKKQQHHRQHYKHNHKCSQQSQNVLLVVAAIVSLICQFVLEVFGGAGAIWGVAELTRLRYGGIDHQSWNIFSWFALVIGLCCLIRFLLMNCVCNDISFYDKYKNEFQLNSSQHDLNNNNNASSQSQSFFFLNKLHIVTKDPILFLRARWCCCYCYCNNSSSLSSSSSSLSSSSSSSSSGASLPTDNNNSSSNNNNNSNNEQTYSVNI